MGKGYLDIAKAITKNVNLDGLQNFFTGLGVHGKDKRLGAQYKRRLRSDSLYFSNLHDSSDIARTVVNKIPDMGTKNWIKHQINKDDGGVDLINKMAKEDERLKAKQKFKKAWKWSRIYGGSAIYVSVLDGLDPKEPLNPKRVQRINTLTVLSNEDIHSGQVDYDINSPNYGYPLYYHVSTRGTSNLDLGEIHHSRIIRFEGQPLSYEGFITNDYWHDSYLNVIEQTIKDYDSAYNSVFSALQDFDLDIIKMEDLAEICSSDSEDEKLIQARLRLMQMSKSIMSAIVLDENESMEKIQREFNNIEKVLDKCDKRLQLATGLPHTVLFGDGPKGGLGSKGESEENTINSLVAEEQDKTLDEPIKKYSYFVMIQRQGPTKGKLIDSWSYNFLPLNEPNDEQKSRVRKNVAEIDKIYYEMGAVSSDEISTSRFGGAEYSMETVINLEEREEQNSIIEMDPEKAKKIIEGGENE